MMPTMMLIMNMITILIVWVGAHSIDKGAMQVGDMMAFIQYSMQIMTSFMMLSMLFVMIPRTSISANRIMEVLNTNPIISIIENAKSQFWARKTLSSVFSLLSLYSSVNLPTLYFLKACFNSQPFEYS